MKLKVLDSMKPAWRDAIFLAIVVALLYSLVIYINLAEFLSDTLARYEHLQLDEIPYLLLFIAVALAWFARRRMAELAETIRHKIEAEQKNLQLLAENRALTKHVLEVQETERLELARELHDDIGQYITGINLDASTLTYHQDENIAMLARRIAQNASQVRNISKQLMKRLRPSVLSTQGLSGALSLLVKDWQDLYPHIRVVKNIAEIDAHLNDGVNIAIFRVVQEALTNIAKHAQADLVEIRLHIDTQYERLELCISDNGSGFDFSTSQIHGFGLIGMRERIQSIGGTIDIRSRLDDGTSLFCHIPLESNVQRNKPNE